jgi:hypothetical protein
MNVKGFAFTVLAAFAVISMVAAWPYEDDEYSAWRLARSSRRSHVSTQ